MLRPAPVLAVTCALFLSACAILKPPAKAPAWTTYEDVPLLNLAMDGLRIGLLADTRIATEQNLSLLARDGRTARPTSTRRPPALERLAPDMLTYALRRLIDEQDVALILYLGNGAENGCSDELNTVFEILERFRRGEGTRKGTPTPIFYVIGNHDYLGGGYTPAMPDRNRLCFDSPVALDTRLNTPVDKFTLLTRIHAFNQANFDGSIPGMEQVAAAWRYIDSYDEKRLYEACVIRDRGRYQHVKAGCYLAGKLIYKDGSEILLVDSSDYYDGGHDRGGFAGAPVFKKSWYGLTGWISTRGPGDPEAECSAEDPPLISQVQWYRCQQTEQPPPVRIVAAHYPPYSLSPIARVVLNNQDTLCALSPLLLPEPRHGNFWFSALTQRPRSNTTIRFDLGLCLGEPESRDLEIGTLNIGSTVDYDRFLDRGTTERLERTGSMAQFVGFEPGAYVASIAMVESDKGSRIVTRHVSPDIRRCDAVLEALRREPTVASPHYVPVRDSLAYQNLFGMGRGFLAKDWTRYDHVYAHRNLEQLLDYFTLRFVAPHESGGLSAEDVRMCLALEASRLANIPGAEGFECKTCPSWRRMRRLEFEERANY